MGLADAFNSAQYVASDFAPSAGVELSPDYTNIASVQDLAELRAVTPLPADKSGAYVEDVGTWYFFDAESTEPGDLAPPYEVVTPDEVTEPDPGRWLLSAGGTGGGTGVEGQFNYEFSRASRRVTDTWLSRGGIPSNINPYVVEFDSKIISVGMSNNSAVACTWVAEVYRNAHVTSGVPDVQNALLTQSIVAGTGSFLVLPVPVLLSAGDQLGVFLRGTDVDSPATDLKLVRV